jgi:hypothetical protein
MLLKSLVVALLVAAVTAQVEVAHDQISFGDNGMVLKEEGIQRGAVRVGVKRGNPFPFPTTSLSHLILPLCVGLSHP